MVIGVWRSLVARCVRNAEVVGSNPAAPTMVLFIKSERLSSWDDGQGDSEG
jgi:hypothetical protein